MKRKRDGIGGSGGRGGRCAGAARGVLALALLGAGVDRAGARDDSGLIAPATVTLRVRPAATVTAGDVTLGDVLAADGEGQALLDSIGSQRLAPAAAGETRVSLEQIWSRLMAAGVNPARVMLKGAAVCRVTAAPRAEPPVAAAPQAARKRDEDWLVNPAASGGEARLAADAARATNGEGPGGPPRVERLSELLVAHINGEMAALGGKALVEFERGGEEFLQLTTPPFEFTIRSADRDKVGLREYVVTLARDRTAQRTVRIGARVQLVTGVVAAARPLNVGAFIRPDDVRVEERVFESAEAVGVREPGLVIGQQVKRFVQPGAMVRAGDVRVADMVTRAQPVTVVVGAGSVAVRASGVALDHGGFGEVVRVRLGEGAERRELRGVVVGVGTVRVDDERAGAAPAGERRSRRGNGGGT